MVAASATVEVVERFSEEGLGGRRDAIGALAEEDDVLAKGRISPAW